MRGVRGVVALLLVAGSVWVYAGQAPAGGGGVLFEGARLIAGDGRAIESAAFLVENGRFARRPEGRGSAAGRRDARRSDRQDGDAGAHRHPQPPRMDEPENGPSTKQSFTRGTVIDHLQRYAYYGVAATLSMGLDRWDVNPELPYQLRNESSPTPRGSSPSAAASRRRRWRARSRTIGWACRTARRPKPKAGRSSQTLKAQERRDDQDLGGRPAEDGAEAAGERLRGDHRRSPQERHARRRPHLQSRRRQAAAEVGRRRLRPRRPRPGRRRAST